MRIPYLLCMVVLLAGPGLSAAPKNVSGRQVRLLALGELPPFQQEIRDNVRYELEPPAGSIPPREVMLGFGGKASEPMPLRLGHAFLRISRQTEIQSSCASCLIQLAIRSACTTTRYR